MVVVQMGPSLACIGKKKSSNWHNPIFVWKSTFWQTLCGFGKPVPFLSWPIKAPKLALASFIYIKKCQPTTRGSLVLWSFHAHGLFWLCIWSTMTVLLPPPEGPTNPADVPASRTKDTPLRTSRLHGVIARFWWMFLWTCEGGERKPARVFSVKPARKMISNIDYPIISHLSNMPTFFWAKTRQIRGADTPRGRNVPGKEAGQRQTKWHTVWCAISICHTWPRR